LPLSSPKSAVRGRETCAEATGLRAASALEQAHPCGWGVHRGEAAEEWTREVLRTGDASHKLTLLTFPGLALAFSLLWAPCSVLCALGLFLDSGAVLCALGSGLGALCLLCALGGSRRTSQDKR